MTFVTQPFIGQELFEHVSSSYEGFENCAQCERKFDNKRELNGHIFLVHEGKKVYRCPICKVAEASKQKRPIEHQIRTENL